MMNTIKNRSHDPRKSPNIVDLIQRLASGPEYPDRPFLINGDAYEKIYALAGGIKAAFAHLDRMDQPVCLCTVNRGYVTAAMLAALSGGPKLILPYAFSAQILEEIQHTLPYTYALVDQKRSLPDGVEAIAFQDQNPLPGTPGTTPRIDPDVPWVYLFTGGTTGTPKIWSKTPLNLLSETAYLARNFRISSNDKILSTAPPNHIYGLLYTVLLPLVSGAAVSADTPAYPGEIIQNLEASQSTVLVSLPAHYRSLKDKTIASHSLHTAFSSGGPLAEVDDQAFFNATGIAVTEIYGSTETGGIAHRRRMAGQHSLTPFSCLEIKIDNQKLCVRSNFLSAELKKGADGFYETADRAISDGSGGFQLLGRSDGVVKVGGKRVDLTRVQQALKEVTGVRDAYVFAISVQSGRQNEILALVEGQVEEDHLQRWIMTNLESYHRPRRIRVVDQIPLSPAGKYNRKAIEKLFT